MESQKLILAAIFTEFTVTGNTGGLTEQELLGLLPNVKRGELLVAVRQSQIDPDHGRYKLTDHGWINAMNGGLSPLVFELEEAERALWRYIVDRVKECGPDLALPVADVLKSLAAQGITERVLRVIERKEDSDIFHFRIVDGALVPDPSFAAYIAANEGTLRLISWHKPQTDLEELEKLGQKVIRWRSETALEAQGGAAGAGARVASVDSPSLRSVLPAAAHEPTPSTEHPTTVFVVHGRDTVARDAMFAFLSSIGLRPLEWSEAVSLTKEASPYVAQILEKAFAVAQAVVVLMTGDDIACLREELRNAEEVSSETDFTPQCRPNVLFEAGMSFGIHPKQTVLVEIGTLRPFSDVLGRHTIRFQGKAEDRTALAGRLETAGCKVNLKGTTWLTAGDFSAAVARSKEASTYSRLQKRQDELLFSSFLRTMPSSGSIAFIRNFNMAGFAFDPDKLNDLSLFFHNWADAEHEFIATDMEKIRLDLHKQCGEYLGFIGLETFPVGDSLQTVPPEWEMEQPERFNRVVGRLHDMAETIVNQHQALVRLGKRKFGAGDAVDV